MASPLVDYRSLMTPDSIVIYHSRKKLLLVAAGSAMFVALGVFILATGKVDDRIVGIACIGLFGLGLLAAIWLLVRRAPALIIHYSGILIDTTRRSKGILHWDEIAGIYIATVTGQRGKQRFLSIIPKDLDAYLSRQSAFQARLAKINISLVGAPINISASTLPMTLEELIQNIQLKCPGIQILSQET
jgi:hypothetical protein